MCETKFLKMCLFYIISTSLRSLNLSFPLLFCVIIYVISTAILKFLPLIPCIAIILHFDPDFPHSQATSPQPHSHPIPRISTLILRISLIPLRNSPFWLLQIASSVCNLTRIHFRKQFLQFKSEHSSLFLLHKLLHQIIVFIVYDVISVITKIYLPYSPSSKISIICEMFANNSESLKRYLSFFVKGRSNLPEIIYFFVICANLQKFT